MTWINTGAARDAMLRLMNTRFVRFVFLVFGLIAVSALLAQPICEAAERQAAGEEGDPLCCSVAAPEALVGASPLEGRPRITAAAPVVTSPVFRPQVVVSNAVPAAYAAPPLVSRYYVRSARIQR